VGARGWVKVSAEEHVQISAGNGSPTRAMAPQQLLTLGASAPTQAEYCTGEALPPGFIDDPQPSLIVPGAEIDANVTVADCRLAIETDTQFFDKFGSVGDATTYVTELIAAVSDRYLTDVQTTFSIAYLGIYSSGTDPWSTPDVPGNTSQMLNEFVAAWSPNTSAGWPASADLAHFLSGASIGGGRAYVGVICSQTSGFAVSGLNGNSNWATFPTQASWLNWDFVVVAHELGHNFNARHTHWYCPPIDQCSSDNCNSTQVCQTSTIMSYCHTCPGGLANIDLEFHPFIANEMRQRVNASCLGDADLSAGGQVTYQVRFRPTSGPGAKSAVLEVTHDAPNAPSPFTLNLTGTSTP
ncbi:MAG: zinc-dependent metalloprotease, partial [Planctomycetota bacterium]